MPTPEGRNATARPDGAREGVWTDGSLLIERYEWTEGDRSGVQWLVYVVKDGKLGLVKVCQTRTRAAEWIASLAGGVPAGV